MVCRRVVLFFPQLEVFLFFFLKRKRKETKRTINLSYLSFSEEKETKRLFIGM
ncbi:hypothetical protein SDC9_66057 [bioreactor metagenome]|uniref:Uncharacterized protein n=1 Tax=bioreactor metagenome TaxID=1076179 RepID=A0A644XV71_9ZZZZ